MDISHSSHVTGNLFILLLHSFPSLNSLALSDCGLNSQDLCSLAQGSVEGRLPKLKHLDISQNWISKELVQLLHHSFPLRNSVNLSYCLLNSQDLCSLAEASVEGRLPQLTHLNISKNSEVRFDDMFQASCTWKELLYLNITWISNRRTERNITGIRNSDDLTHCRRFQSLMVRF